MELTFEEQIAREIRNSVLKEVQSTAFLRLQYEQRKVLPEGMLDKLWDSVNWDEVLEQIRPAIQTRICNTVIGAMETEVKTDVKSLLSVEGVRQKLRMNVYPELMKVLNDVE